MEMPTRFLKKIVPNWRQMSLNEWDIAATQEPTTFAGQEPKKEQGINNNKSQTWD